MKLVGYVTNNGLVDRLLPLLPEATLNPETHKTLNICTLNS